MIAVSLVPQILYGKAPDSGESCPVQPRNRFAALPHEPKYSRGMDQIMRTKLEFHVAHGQSILEDTRQAEPLLHDLSERFDVETGELETVDFPDALRTELQQISVLRHIRLPQTRKGKGAKSVLVVRQNEKVISFFPQISGASDTKHEISIASFLQGLCEGRVESLHPLDLGQDELPARPQRN